MSLMELKKVNDSWHLGDLLNWIEAGKDKDR